MELGKEDNKLRDEAQAKTKPARLSPQAFASAFGPAFLDAATCRDTLLMTLHPAGPACPDCGAPVPEKQRARFLAWQRVTCPCGRTYGPTTGTHLAGSNLDPCQVVALLVGLGLDLDSTTTARLARVSRETVRIWRAKLTQEQTAA